MSGEQVGVNQIIDGLLEGATTQIMLATDGATDQQLYYRPTNNANNIASEVHLRNAQQEPHVVRPLMAYPAQVFPEWRALHRGPPL
jgi:hypothetical protein